MTPEHSVPVYVPGLGPDLAARWIPSDGVVEVWDESGAVVWDENADSLLSAQEAVQDAIANGVELHCPVCRSSLCGALGDPDEPCSDRCARDLAAREHDPS